jgi:hypothetical protein
VWDLEGVRPLFNVPAAVTFGQKSPEETMWPLAGRVVTGDLEGRRNASTAEAAERLSEGTTEYWLSIRGARSYFSETKEKAATEGSPYAKKFAEGATIFPRSCWFVEIQKPPGLGYDPARPYLRTDPRAIEGAKEQYQDVRLEGNVESEFLYSTLLSTDLVPFGHLPFRTVVLPILWKPEGYAMLTASEARRQGYVGLAEWLEVCERIWKEKRGDKAERESVYGWLDYRKKLTQQRRKRYTVVYPDVNRIMLGSVLADEPVQPTRDYQAEMPGPLMIESAMYYMDTNEKAEAFFLASWLNAPIIDKMLQSFRRKEQGGHPHVHKKVWGFPIPSYDPSSAQHRSMASLGEECARSVARITEAITAKGDRAGLVGLRNRIREELKEQLTEIDALAKDIL